MNFEWDREKSRIKASDFDIAFDKGDVSEHLDLKSAKAHHPVQRASIDFLPPST